MSYIFGMRLSSLSWRLHSLKSPGPAGSWGCYWAWRCSAAWACWEMEEIRWSLSGWGYGIQSNADGGAGRISRDQCWGCAKARPVSCKGWRSGRGRNHQTSLWKTFHPFDAWIFSIDPVKNTHSPKTSHKWLSLNFFYYFLSVSSPIIF